MSTNATRRRMMVDTQVRPSDVTKFPIIDAMLAVPRELYVPDQAREAAYAGENISLGDGRVVLEPRTLAKMLDALDIRGDEMVLDVGAGLGYSTAVIARMAEAVVALEEDETLAAEAEAALTSEEVDNAAVITGPLAEGAAKHGPYDVILFQGGVEELPDGFTSQLTERGRIACLFVEDALGTVKIGHNHNGKLSWRFAFNAGAPVLPGFAKEAAFAL